MGVFSAKAPPTLHRGNIINSNIWLTDIGDKKKELLNTKKKLNTTKLTSK